MQLNSSQLSILEEIGIPVWELRLQNVEPALQQREVLTAETKIQYQQSWIVVVDKIEDNSSKQALLYAMLKAINVSYDDVAVITSDDYLMLDLDSTNNKIMLVLGSAALSYIDGISESIEQCRGKIHQIDSDIVVSYGLDELLNDPTKKAAVWQDLLFAKRHYQQMVTI
ncbi:MAG: DNA polymerase III subunit psi [Gammaproteobacteria bacterium]|nr:DNA polymerase III subunit psi [Gammaproteobacteria bacterium]